MFGDRHEKISRHERLRERILKFQDLREFTSARKRKRARIRVTGSYITVGILVAS